MFAPRGHEWVNATCMFAPRLLNSLRRPLPPACPRRTAFAQVPAPPIAAGLPACHRVRECFHVQNSITGGSGIHFSTVPGDNCMVQTRDARSACR